MFLLLHDELGRLRVYRHILNLIADFGRTLLLQHFRLHRAPLLVDLIRLLDNQVTATDILIRDSKADDRMELLMSVLLVQVHAVREHFLNISNLDGHVG